MDEKKVNLITSLINKVGFPILVVVWLLYERWTGMHNQESALRDLTQAINENTALIQHLMASLGGG